MEKARYLTQPIILKFTNILLPIFRTVTSINRFSYFLFLFYFCFFFPS